MKKEIELYYKYKKEKSYNKKWIVEIQDLIKKEYKH